MSWRKRLLACRLSTLLVLVLCALAVPAVWAQTPPRPAELRVVGDNNFPPFLFLDAAGNPQGYTVDLWRLWEQKTGVRVYLSAMQWDQAQQTLQDGGADVIDTIYRTPPREALYDFARPYADQPGAIYRHASLTGIRDLSGLQGFQVGVQAGDACIDHLARAGITAVRTYPSYAALLDGAQAGQIRLFCMDDYPAGYYLYQRGLHQEFVKAFVLYHGEVTHAVRKGDARTLALVEQGMSAITAEEREGLRRRWLSAPEPRLVDLPPAVLGALAGGVGVAGLLVIWVLLLRRQVHRRTAELERERQGLLAVINTIPDLVWLKDPQGRYLACNRRFEQLYGVEERALLGHTDYDFVDVDTADFFRENDRRAMEAGEPRANEAVLTFASDGHKERVQTIKAPVRGPDGRLIGVLGIARDLTDLLAARDALDEQRARVHRLQQMAGAVDWTVDLATLRWHWDEAHDRLLGRPAGAGEPGLDALLAHVVPHDRDRVRLALAPALAGEPVAPIPFGLLGADGQIRPAELLTRIESDAHGRPARLHGVTRLRDGNRDIPSGVPSPA